MADPLVRSRFSDKLTSRRGAWVGIGVALVVIVGLFALFGGAQAPSRTGQAPVSSESSQVDELLDQFPDADVQSVVVVASRVDGGELTKADISSLKGLLPTLDSAATSAPTGPLVSQDGGAAVINVPIKVGADGAETAKTVGALRSGIAAGAPQGLDVYVTGGPAFGADVASAFDGADTTLLLVTIVIVAFLLIVTYRSPILWLVPSDLSTRASSACWCSARAPTTPCC